MARGEAYRDLEKWLDRCRTALAEKNAEAARLSAELAETKRRVKQLEHGYDTLRTALRKRERRLDEAERLLRRCDALLEVENIAMPDLDAFLASLNSPHRIEGET